MRKAATLLLFNIFFCGCLNQTAAPDQKAGYRVVHGWPVLPDDFALGQVSGVAVDSHNHVFIFHRGSPPVICFEGESGRWIDSWGEDLFATPHGLAVDSEDNVWLTDTGSHLVMKFSHQGDLLLTVGEKGVAGWDKQHFDQPSDVVIAPNGEFYVTDGYGNSRVVKFSGTGEFLLEWGSKGARPGQFDLPHGITMDSAGRLYVADRSNSRIQVFDGKGAFLGQWKNPQLGRPWGVEVGPDGFLYVVDGGDMNPAPPDRGRALRLDLEGNILESWGSFGSYDGQFYWAHDVAAGPHGEVYVADVHLGMRVQKFIKAGPISPTGHQE